MDHDSKKIVDISTARIKIVEVEKRKKIEKFKKYLFIVVVVLLVFFGIYSYDPNITEPLLNAQHPITKTLENGDVQVSLSQGAGGHYIFIGQINGKEVKFLLDTGATNIAVPTGVANYLGMPFGKTYYSTTANGKALSYASKAKEVRVGEIYLFDVKASVATGMEGDEILLGMSFLKNLKVVQENGKMYLIQKKLITKSSTRTK
ncbi:retropepsin-like aspartic protease family protein [Marinicellulosiphila megalodicopiae]|uniref:retropepsin-like aspartic protease family protein n=1 Tax=Marinicellulosiphila megalodicopiae TaxID=2724896 RepID=UPI003BB0F23B